MLFGVGMLVREKGEIGDLGQKKSPFFSENFFLKKRTPNNLCLKSPSKIRRLAVDFNIIINLIFSHSSIILILKQI